MSSLAAIPFDTNYTAVPTLRRFHASNAFFRGVMGPVGSGKSCGVGPMEVHKRAMEQAPWRGVRLTRWAAVRNTYGELETSTIKTWMDWIPEGIRTIVHSHPIVAKVKFTLPDDSVVSYEVWFIALDRPEHVKKLLSVEFTGGWLNEAREIAKAVVDGVSMRVGRYPMKEKGGASWYGFWGDTNPPSTNHWWYRFAEFGEWRTIDDVKKLGEWQFFRQPGGLVRVKDAVYRDNPAAENIDNLPGGYNYYWRQLSGKEQEWINVYILGLYGNLFSGRPVYDGSYNDALHVAPETLGVFENVPLRLSFDFGLTPAALIWQLSPRGQLRVYREFCTENTSLRELIGGLVQPALANEFDGYKKLIINGDPAGKQRSQVDKVSLFEEIKRLMGIDPIPAPTNDFKKRRQAVISRLTTTTDGRPGLILDPSCRMLREGFQGGYQFGRIQVVGADARFHEEPVKNQYSHIHDALQYAASSVDVAYQDKNGEGAPQNKQAAKQRWKGFT